MQQNEKSASKLNKKAWWQIRKNKTKITKFSQKHAQYALRSKLKQKIAIIFEKKEIRKTEICKKQAQRTSKIQLKQATRKSSRKPANPQKSKPKFAGKPQGWQHWAFWPWIPGDIRVEVSCSCFLSASLLSFDWLTNQVLLISKRVNIWPTAADSFSIFYYDATDADR